MPGRVNSSALAQALSMLHCRLLCHCIGPYARTGWVTSLALAQALRMFPCKSFSHSAAP